MSQITKTEDIWFATSHNNTNNYTGVAINHSEHGEMSLVFSFDNIPMLADMSRLCALYTTSPGTSVSINTAGEKPKYNIHDVSERELKYLRSTIYGKLLQSTIDRLRNCAITLTFCHAPERIDSVEYRALKKRARRAMSEFAAGTYNERLLFSIPNTDINVYINSPRWFLGSLPSTSSQGLLTNSSRHQSLASGMLLENSPKDCSKTNTALQLSVRKHEDSSAITNTSNNGKVFLLCLTCTRIVAVECPRSHTLGRFGQLKDEYSNAVIMTTCKSCLNEGDRAYGKIENRGVIMTQSFYDLNISPNCFKHTMPHKCILSMCSDPCRIEYEGARLEYASIQSLNEMCDLECIVRDVITNEGSGQVSLDSNVHMGFF
ncbi:BgTH12-07670 [Blumeria graminis f. sp. triticale]|uniref:BgTH12-07670 n=1 Tax=Blumeria graminis f. sp. triticale TaxID=1689686 RepID=A0A9W4CXR7_BLUGR|nr:BgTH12-07670 [Blumeria graminis f. sp. triticale]